VTGQSPLVPKAVARLAAALDALIVTGRSGRVTKVSADGLTVDVQPVVAEPVQTSTGVSYELPPPVPSCPVVFLGGGEAVRTVRPVVGDRVLLLPRDIDHTAWDAGGDDDRDAASTRRHDIADSVALLMPRTSDVTAAQMAAVGDIVDNLPSGGALRVGDASASREVADGPKMLDRIQRLEGAVNVVALAAGAPTQFTGAPTYTPSAATLTIGQVATGRIKVDS